MWQTLQLLSLYIHSLRTLLITSSAPNKCRSKQHWSITFKTVEHPIQAHKIRQNRTISYGFACVARGLLYILFSAGRTVNGWPIVCITQFVIFLFLFSMRLDVFHGLHIFHKAVIMTGDEFFRMQTKGLSSWNPTELVSLKMLHSFIPAHRYLWVRLNLVSLKLYNFFPIDHSCIFYF